MVNETIIIGRLVTDPELKELDSGRKVVNLTVAVPRSYKNKDGKYDSDFIDCTFWEHNAEYVSKMSKGNEILVKGRTETNLYEKDDKKVKDYKLIASYTRNLEKKNEKTDEMDM